jgi:acyl carrier protein
MTRDEITTAVKDVFETTLKVEPERLEAGTALRDELQLDSLDMIEVVYEIEERFDVQIPEEKLNEIDTFGQIIDGLVEAIAAKGSA